MTPSVPESPEAHTQGTDIDELQQNLRQVIEMLLGADEPKHRLLQPTAVTSSTRIAV